MSDDNKTPIQSEGWKQWSQNVKESLEKLERKVDRLEDRITKHREEQLVEVSTLKARAGIIGMVTGFVVSTVMSIIVGLLVWQLTVGAHQTTSSHKHEIPATPESIGYVLPPRENYNDFFVIREDVV